MRSYLVPGRSDWAWSRLLFALLGLIVITTIAIAVAYGTAAGLLLQLLVPLIVLEIVALIPGIILQNRARAAEARAGYTTMPAGRRGDRDLDEVDPSTGVVIRPAGGKILTDTQRKDERARAKQYILSLPDQDRPPLPKGWSRNR